MNIAAIEKATGQPWAEWVKFFESIGAKDLDHHDIVLHVYDYMEQLPGGPAKSGKQPGGQSPSGWWSQNVTVAYEQHIGRRVPGQDHKGEFSVAVSKTLPGNMDQALETWLAYVQDITEFDDSAITPVKVSKTDKWRHWRTSLSDGTKLVVSIFEKSPGKSSLTVTHEKLKNAEHIEQKRTFWKQFLANL